MNKVAVSAVLLIASTLVCALGVAKSPEAEGRKAERQAQAEARFSEADKNRDGKISLAEMQDQQDKRLAERFAKLDANRDGGVSRDELRQAQEARKNARQQRQAQRRGKMKQFAALDTDNDGAFSRAELGDKAPKLVERFDQIDADRDGKLSREEMRAARGKR